MPSRMNFLSYNSIFYVYFSPFFILYSLLFSSHFYSLPYTASDDFSADLGDEWLRRERVRRSLEQRKPKRSLHSHSERNDHGAYFMQDSSFLFMKDADILSDVKLIIDNESEWYVLHRL